MPRVRVVCAGDSCAVLAFRDPLKMREDEERKKGAAARLLRANFVRSASAEALHTANPNPTADPTDTPTTTATPTATTTTTPTPTATPTTTPNPTPTATTNPTATPTAAPHPHPHPRPHPNPFALARAHSDSSGSAPASAQSSPSPLRSLLSALRASDVRSPSLSPSPSPPPSPSPSHSPSRSPRAAVVDGDVLSAVSLSISDDRVPPRDSTVAHSCSPRRPLSDRTDAPDPRSVSSPVVSCREPSQSSCQDDPQSQIMMLMMHRPTADTDADVCVDVAEDKEHVMPSTPFVSALAVSAASAPVLSPLSIEEPALSALSAAPAPLPTGDFKAAVGDCLARDLTRPHSLRVSPSGWVRLLLRSHK